MALPGFIVGAGPEQSNSEQPYFKAVSGDWAVVDDAGTKYFEWVGDGTTKASVICDNSKNTFDTYRWASVREWRLIGNFALVGDRITLFSLGGIYFGLECVTSTSQFKVWAGQSQDTPLGTGTTTFSVGTSYHSLRIQTNQVRIKVWVDGNLEINIAHTQRVRFTRIETYKSPNMQSGQTARARRLILVTSSSEQDRPGVDVTAGIHQPDGNRKDEYGDQSDCTNGSTTGDFTRVDDWASGDANDATDFNCENAGDTGIFVVTVTNATVANIIGLQVWARGRTNLEPKTVATKLRIEDASGNFEQYTNLNLASLDWDDGRRTAGFHLAPDAGSWTQTKLDAHGIGISSINSNGANDQWTAIMSESFGVDNDPPPVADRRRLLNAA